MTFTRHLLAAVALATLAAPLAAAPANVAAAVAAPDRPEGAKKLDADRKPVEVLKFLGLEAGDRAVEVMAGNGYYAELMGKAVGPKGAVIALEPPGFLTDKGRAAWAELRTRTPNVLLQAQMPGDTALAPRSLDFALMHLTYHDLYWESEQYKFPRIDPAVFLAKLYAAMKPGGIVGVVDHVAEAGGDTRKIADSLHRIDPEVIKADFKAAGFVLEAESDVLRTPSDDKSKLVFDPSVRGKTDRVVYRFRKPRA
jgi:predicted methyltransferase